MRSLIAALILGLTSIPAAGQVASTLPPVSGPIEPKVAPRQADDGLYHQTWEVTSFLNLREDFEDATVKQKRFAVFFEQRGCVYCTKMHKDVLAQRYINDYVRDNYAVVQLDIFGAREVTDFDGTKLSEAKLAERWGVMFTPTVVFLKDELPVDPKLWGPPLEVTRMSLGFGAATFYDLFVWIRNRVYEHDRNFQRFHVARMGERGKSGIAFD